MKIIDRIADRVDLAIDFLTLGQYGLEGVDTASARASTRDVGCEGGGLRRCDESHREALPPTPRRGGCKGRGRPAASQPAA